MGSKLSSCPVPASVCEIALSVEPAKEFVFGNVTGLVVAVSRSWSKEIAALPHVAYRFGGEFMLEHRLLTLRARHVAIPTLYDHLGQPVCFTRQVISPLTNFSNRVGTGLTGRRFPKPL